jgi:citrate lyase subunit beta/citryl-CoA lyase
VTAVRPRRSCLTVPGDDERKLAKAAASAADEVVVDLEDAVAPARKEEAREIAARALRELEWRPPMVALRINGRATSWWADDVELLRTLPVATVVVPKVESLDDVTGLSVPVEALIETAAGLVACEQIAQSPAVEALIVGPGDLAASLGIPELTIGAGAHLDYALPRVLVAARAAGIAAIDGPFPAFADEAGFELSAQRTRQLGYDGKWCIHPVQIERANRIYGATSEEVERARRILASEGVTTLDGEMVDEANRRMARATLARAGLDAID